MWQTSLVYGPARSGKTCFALTFARAALTRTRVCYVTSDAPAAVLDSARDFLDVDLAPFVRSGQLTILGFARFFESKVRSLESLEKPFAELKRLADERHFEAFVFDGIDPAIFWVDSSTAKPVVRSLIEAMGTLGATCLCTGRTEQGVGVLGLRELAASLSGTFEIERAGASGVLRVHNAAWCGVEGLEMPVDFIQRRGIVVSSLPVSRRSIMGSEAQLGAARAIIPDSMRTLNRPINMEPATDREPERTEPRHELAARLAQSIAAQIPLTTIVGPPGQGIVDPNEPTLHSAAPAASEPDQGAQPGDDAARTTLSAARGEVGTTTARMASTLATAALPDASIEAGRVAPSGAHHADPTDEEGNDEPIPGLGGRQGNIRLVLGVVVVLAVLGAGVVRWRMEVHAAAAQAAIRASTTTEVAPRSDKVPAPQPALVPVVMTPASVPTAPGLGRGLYPRPRNVGRPAPSGSTKRSDIVRDFDDGCSFLDENNVRRTRPECR